MASSIVSSAAYQLGALLVEEAKYLYAVRDKIERLRSDLAWMQCFLEDADNRQHREKVVGMWVAEIRDFAYEAEDLIERYVHQVSHPRETGIWDTIRWSLFVLADALTLHDVGSSIDDLRNRISELVSRLQIYGIQIIRQSESSLCNFGMREQRRTYSHIEEDPVGLEKHIKEVVDQLMNNDGVVKVVGVCGMGGMGKTTLARKVFSNTAVKMHFKSNLVWVYISKQFERRSIFEEILIRLSRTDKGEDSRKAVKDLTNEELPIKICEIIEEKRCLVVLDDIWNSGAWDTLKPAFESLKRSGSKILITTRDKGLVQHADSSGYSHPFGFLCDKDSWTLLQQKAFLEPYSADPEMKKKLEALGKDMLKHCKGLPLAIVALGGILATKRTINEWETVYKNITTYLMSDMGRESDRISSVLELSYNDLPFYLKPCFLYLGSFPEDFEIVAQRLFHLWEAEGLVAISADQGVSLDDIAEMYLNELVKRCMVQVGKSWPNGRIKTCRLHDVMRDMCLKKCQELNFLNTVEQGGSTELSSSYAQNSCLVSRKLHRCVVYVRDGCGSPFQPHQNETSYTRSLLVFPYESNEVTELVSRDMGKFFSLLRVLDIERASIVKFPSMIKDLIHLRYLNLRRTWVSELHPCIWQCKYLETLDLRSRVAISLSNELWKLERLRHLCLPRRLIFEGAAAGEKLILTPNQLRLMETLKNFDVRICRIEDLAELVNLRIFSFSKEMNFMGREVLVALLKSPAIVTERLVNLLKLDVSAETINKEPTILSPLNPDTSISVSLQISGRIEVAFGDTSTENAYTQIFPRNLRRVHLKGCEVISQGISVLEKLPLLQELVLEWNSIRGNKMRFCDGAFDQLVELHLDDLEDLEEWEVGEGALPNLRQLEIWWCKKLKSIPEGLPSSLQIHCYNPCINGIEKYNTCPHYKP